MMSRTATPLIAAALATLATLAGAALAGQPGTGVEKRDAAFLGQFVAARDAVGPGGTVDVALRLRHDPGFHTYWSAPGIVGVPTKIEWTETGGLTPGELGWQQPQSIKMGPYDAYGYEGEAFLVVPFTAPADAPVGGVATLAARVSYMVCPATLDGEAGCHPGFVDLELEMPIGAAAGDETEWAEPIAAAKSTFAAPDPSWGATAARSGDRITLTLSPSGEASPLPSEPLFFSSDGLIHSDRPQVIRRGDDGSITFQLEVSEFGPDEPTHLPGILYTKSGFPDSSGAKPIWLEPELTTAPAER